MKKYQLKSGVSGYDSIPQNIPYFENELPGDATITVAKMVENFPKDWEEVVDSYEITSAIQLLKENGYTISKSF